MESYEIEQKLKDFQPEPNWDKFKPLRRSYGRNKQQPPLVSITKTSISFNKPIQKDNFISRNVEIETAPGPQILFIFKDHASENTYRVTLDKGGARISSAGFALRIAEMADLRTKLFHYKFRPTYYSPEERRLVINLADKPYSKVSVKEHKHD